MTSTATADELRAQAQGILSRPTLTKEDSAKVSGLLDLANQIDGREDRLREARSDQLARELGRPTKVDARMQEFRGFLRTGERRSLDESGGNVLDGTGGAYLVPVDYQAEVVEAMKQADQLVDRAACSWIDSTNGRPLTLPLADDTSVDGETPGESTQDNLGDVAALGSVVFPEAIKFRSKFIRVSIEEVQDSGVPIDGFLSSAFAKRLARAVGSYLITTLMAGAANSGVVVVGNDNANSPDPTVQIGYGDLLNCIDSIDASYLESPKAAWVMRRATLTYIASLRDKQGHPLGLVERDPVTGTWWLLNFPVRLCPSMDALGAANKPVLLGDLSRLWVRAVTNGMTVDRVTPNSGSILVKKLVEKWADYGQVGFFATWRLSAGVAAVPSQSTPPFVYLGMHS